MPVSSGTAALLALPAYTTVTAQAFSPDGSLLASANDRGRVALFRTTDIVAQNDEDDIDKPRASRVFFVFEAGTCLEENSSSARNNATTGTVNALGSVSGFLLAAIARPANSEPAIVAFSWKDLGQRRLKVAWSIDNSSGLLPTDVNSITFDDAEEKLFIGGGVGASGSEPGQDFSIRVVDLETRMLTRPPMMGHTAYVHALSWSNGFVASASEDGTARTWDVTSKKPNTAIIEPSKDSQLARPHMGKWLGDISVQGEWMATGGGPNAALWHLRAQAPVAVPDIAQEKGALHVTSLIEDRLVIGGQLGNMVYQSNLRGQVIAEIKTTAPCIYSVASTKENCSPKILALAGASSRIDLCTHNFSYCDNTITFPTTV